MPTWENILLLKMQRIEEEEEEEDNYAVNSHVIDRQLK